MLSRRPLAVGLAAIIGATAAVTLAMDGAHNGRIAGNEAMAVSALWGFGGLALTLAERRYPGPCLRSGARAVLTAAVLYLVMGALLGNARWAVPAMRLLGYVGVLGSVWAAEAVLIRCDPHSDVNGLLSLTAAGAGFFASAFEVVRWLAPVFRLPLGQPVTPEILAWQESTRVFGTGAVWAVYAFCVLACGVKLRSPSTRQLSAAFLGVGITYIGAAGLTNPTAHLALRGGATLLLAAAALAGAYLVHRAPGQRHPRERLIVPALAVGGVALPALWGLMVL